MPIAPFTNIRDAKETDIPVNQPTLNLSDSVGPGWASVGVGELIKTHYQVFTLFTQPPIWNISSFFTSDQYHSNGRSSYRRPTSLWTWIAAMSKVPTKYWYYYLFWWRHHLARPPT